MGRKPSLLYWAPLPVVILLAWAVAPLTLSAAEPPVLFTAEDAELFEREIRPLLVSRCLECHGGDKSKAIEGNLNLTTRAGILAGGDSGPAALAGSPADSPMILAVQHADGRAMPPEGKLTEVQVASLVRWVERGLPWPDDAGELTSPNAQGDLKDFWSFQPVADPQPPAVTDPDWNQHPVDQFIRARLDAAGLTPVPLTDKRTLLRRATFDLLGLPPTPAEMNDFLADETPAAFAKVVDRLLASPHYGERWGRHWLDLARYADTAGETADFPVPEAYRYRNYVIDAFNRDKPYDEFIREQIAGDILAAEGARELYAQRVTATGFLALSRRFGFDPQNYHHLTIADTIDTVGRSVLGLSLGCARCHDHKYDPVSAADYYALYGIFNSSNYAFPGSEEVKRPRDFLPLLPTAEVATIRAPFELALAQRGVELTQAQETERLAKEALAAAMAKLSASAEPERAAAQAEVDTLQQQLSTATAAVTAATQTRDAAAAGFPVLELAYGVREGTPANCRVQLRGEPLDLGPEVPRRFLEILGGQTLAVDASGSGRRQLADWLTAPENPLTARVLVNRVWQHHFGRGLVATSSDFGTRGLPPSHPELLDWLATRFIQDGWSIKALHRRIMLARVYQISSQIEPAARELDPNNVLCSHFNRRRLDAESIRDALLAVGGELDRMPGGAHPFPPVEQWGFTQHTPFKADYDSRKRSVYLMSQRIRRHPYLALFDGPDPNSSTAERGQSTTPLQALFMLNDPLVHAQAEQLARQLLSLPSADVAARVARGYELTLARPPSAEETAAAEAFLNTYQARVLAGGSAPTEQQMVAIYSGFARALLSSNEFLFID